MERYNPFASAGAPPDELNPFGSSPHTRSSDTALSSIGTSMGHNRQPATSRTDSLGADRRQNATTNSAATSKTPLTPITRYTTSFPDPFGLETTTDTQSSEQESPRKNNDLRSFNNASSSPNPRSSSVTFANSVEEPTTQSTISSFNQSATAATAAPTTPTTRPIRGQSGGLSSFLSRATSVTSSSVTDRVNEAVGSVRSAVDSISSQIQAVPSNINERLTSTATNLMGNQSQQQQQQQQQQQDQQIDQQQQSAASYLASKFSSATNQFSSSSNQSSSSLPVISRQRVVLILDNVSSIDWSQQFVNYRRLIAGLGPASSGPQSALSNFFTSATAQLTSGGSASSLALSGEGADLVEQADFRDISVLANQSSSTATVLVSSPSSSSSSSSSSGASALITSGSRQTSPGSRSFTTANGVTRRIVRTEYVVIRQRSGKGDSSSSDHLKGIVTAFNYCLVPMFEPLEVWNTFQDKQLVFSRLLRIQKSLGKENFPLIPQVFCQTHQDLLNHVNSSTVSLPCLIRTGQLGKGRMRADNLQMLKDFASIVATSGLSCTVEPHLDVKCDLIVQKLGTSLKIFKRNNSQATSEMPNSNTSSTTTNTTNTTTTNNNNITNIGDERDGASQTKQSASRQTSLGSSVLSSLIPQQRRSSIPSSPFDRMTEMVNVRYKNWVDAVSREFDNKLEMFCLKIVITQQDREYIVGLSNCSMDFLGSSENQEEDRRSFVELIISNMNTLLPKHSLSREPSANLTPTSASVGVSSSSGPIGAIRRSSSDDKAALGAQSSVGRSGASKVQELNGPMGDKKKFISQTQINGVNKSGRGNAARTYGQLSSRSQSVSVNQSDYLEDQPMVKSSYFTRRGSERSDSITNDATDDGSIRDGSTVSDSMASGLHQRQASLGQSFLDQTSTAFSSLHKQSMSFFKRLDTRAGGELGSTPPMSAKSDKGFDRTFAPNRNTSLIDDTEQQVGGSRRNGDFKSQSVDCSNICSGSPLGGSSNRSIRGKRETPPKPPPPTSLGSRQSSLASYSSTQRAPSSSMTTPNSTPNQSRQNTTDQGTNDGSDSTISHRTNNRVIRQNSALSAFEPFDPELRASLQLSREPSSVVVGGGSDSILDSKQVTKSLEPSAIKRGSQFDSASITSGDSNSTSETTTAEDTMNNLKKTFASIFGDKCE